MPLAPAPPVPLDEIMLPDDPLRLLGTWVSDAERAGCADANALVLATAAADGRPSARTVLMTGLHGDGLQFHTSRPTSKTADLDANPLASAVFRWAETHRQVVLHGAVSELDDDANDASFATRPRALQLIAWVYDILAADPSAAAPTKEAIDDAYAELARTWTDRVIPRPPSWTGFLLVPGTVDFWQRGTLEPPDGTPNERIRYRHDGAGWQIRRMLP